MTNAAALRCRMLHLDKGSFLDYNEQRSVRGDSMNKAVTTKEEILKTGRELIRQQGWAAINIRAWWLRPAVCQWDRSITTLLLKQI